MISSFTIFPLFVLRLLVTTTFYKIVFAIELSSVKIALIPKHNSPFFTDVFEGCQKEAVTESRFRAIEIICDIISPTSAFEDDDATKQQIEILENILENRTHDGVAISVNDVTTLTPVIDRVVDAGIPLVTFDSDAKDSKRLAYIGTNNTSFGDQLAKVLLQIMPTGGKFGIVTSLGADNIAERVKGVRNRLKDTKWKEVHIKDGKGNPLVSLEVMREMITETPSLNAIIPVAMWPMVNASNWKEFVEENQNLTNVVGDSSQDQLMLLSHGYCDGLIGQMPYEMGVESLRILVSTIIDRILPKKEIRFTNIVQILRVPLNLPDLSLDHNFLGHIAILGYCLFSIVIVTIVGFVAWTWKNQKSRVVRASQPEFLYIVLVGTAIFSTSIITFSIDHEKQSLASCRIACILNHWFLSVGFTIIFAALYSKARRINIIMKESTKFKRVKVMPKDVILPFVLLLTTNIIILITWTIHDPKQYAMYAHEGTDDWNRQFSFYGRCTSQHATNYYASLLVVNMVALILALYETYKTRNLRTEFNESIYILVVFVCMFQAAVIGIPVVVTTYDRPRVATPVIQLVVFFTSMATLLFIFVPKIISLRKRPKKHNGRGTLTQQYLEKHPIGDSGPGESSNQPQSFLSGLAVLKFVPQRLSSRRHSGEDDEKKEASIGKGTCKKKKSRNVSFVHAHGNFAKNENQC